MKRNMFVTALCCAALPALAQTSSPAAVSSPAAGPDVARLQSSKYSVVERGANHKVFERLEYQRTPGGNVVARPHRYTAIGTGMHYQDAGGAWKEAKEVIRPAAGGGAEAIEGRHSVYFPYDIYSGVIRTVTPSGVQLKSRPLCISYFDGANSYMIAELTNSVGQILPSGNQIIYTNAFSQFADLLCTYRKGGIECDLVLRSQIPSPAECGLNPSTSRLELITEWFDTPEPRQLASPARATDALADVTLDFGSMRMIRGKAFAIGAGSSEGAIPKAQTPVSKSWTHIEGRACLIEEVPVQQIAPELQALPAPIEPDKGVPGSSSGQSKGPASRLLPPSRVVQASTNAVRFAKRDVSPRSGFALDYTLVQTQDSFTFQGDTTYFVDSDVFLGTATIEGNTVIKHYTNTASINVYGALQCQTAPYKPALLTSFDDNTVGESITTPDAVCTGTVTLDIANNYGYDIYVYVWDDNGNYIVCGDDIGSGSDSQYSFNAGLGQHYSFYAYDTYDWNWFWLDFWPAQQSDQIEVDQYGNVNYSESGGALCTPPPAEPVTALTLAGSGAAPHDLRICNVDIGISASSPFSLTNLQFINCGTAVQTEGSGAQFYAGNILMSQVGTGFSGGSFQGVCQHLTFDQGADLTYDPSGPGSQGLLTLTNCILTGVGSIGVVPVTTNFTVTLSTNTGVFQPCGGGGYYLAANSFQNAGTANIDPGLLGQLRAKTTYPPIVYSNAEIYTLTNLAPQAQRDCLGNPDLGFHYPPLDYAFGGCDLYTNLTFAPGTAVGWFHTTSGWYHAGQGIHIDDQKILTFSGHVDAPCYWVRCNMVQEDSSWGQGYGPGGITGWADQNSGTSAYSPEAHLNFTRCSVFATDESHIRDDWGYITVRANNSEIWSGSIGCYVLSCYMTNCLHDRASIGNGEGHPGNALSFRNCTFHGANLTLTPSQTPYPAYVHDCAFDGTAVSAGNLSSSDFNYNAFTNGMTRFPTGGTHDVTNLLSFNWQTSWLGNYYLPGDSTLINADTSVTADQLGLYHFTTQTNQVKEATTPLDIGYHYVAVNGNGNPIDSNGNGIPDYLEDVNGNGQGLTIALLAPQNAASYAEPATVPVQASVMDWRSIVTNVQFLCGTNSIAGLTTAPYSYSWPCVASGAYIVTATAQDLAGSSAASLPISISVTNLCSQ